MKVHLRKLIVRSGSGGPRHDPYSFVEYTVHQRLGRQRTTKEFVLHMGLDTFLEVNGKVVTQDEQTALVKFCALVGVHQFKMIQKWEARKYFTDSCEESIARDWK